MLRFQINELPYITILSLFQDKLLIGCLSLSQLLIYDCEGRYLFTIYIIGQPRDAIWTSNGSIVLTKFNYNTVVVISDSGKVITTHTQISNPGYFSASDDGIIYLADIMEGVYQSTDNGMSWGLVFKSANGWHCLLVIKVTKDYFDDFWALEFDSSKYHLRVYSVNTNCFTCNVTWIDVNATTIFDKHINLSPDSIMLHDGFMSVFFSDFDNKLIQVFSIDGLYCCQLPSFRNGKQTAWKMVINNKRHLLYVGYKSQVEVFELTYGKKD